MLQTMAKVQLKCFSFTEAYACVSVTATAEAWAEATADAHASAVSSAVAGCGCLTDAVADSFSDASTYLKLVAKAASTATAAACLDGAHSPPCTCPTTPRQRHPKPLNTTVFACICACLGLATTI